MIYIIGLYINYKKVETVVVGKRGKPSCILHIGDVKIRVEGIWRSYTIITDTISFSFLHIAIDYALQIMNINFFLN